MYLDGNSAVAQRKRILDFLHIQPLDTLTARKELDIMHPAARVMELLKPEVGIKTIKIDRPSDCGKIHRVACYVLEFGAVAAAPAGNTETSQEWAESRKHGAEVA